MKLCECGCGDPAPISKETSRTHGYVRGEPRRFIKGHQRRGSTHSPETRAKISAAKAGKPSGRGNPGAKCRHCHRRVRAQGLCNAHYKKLLKYGDALAGSTNMRGATRMEQYLAKIDKRGPGECWPWTAGRSEKNYAMIADGEGGSMPAHRYGFGELVRPLEPGEVVDHTCHNIDDTCPGGNTCEHRGCQNPAHWQAVTDEVNQERGKSFSAVNGRKESCKWGHELTPDNSYGYKGRRQCKTCARLAARGQHPRQLAKLGQLPFAS
jgi:hypothetical protein